MIRSLLTGALLLLTAPAMADPIHLWVDPNEPMPTRQEFIDLLENNGIKISYKNGCGRTGKSLAVYNPRLNTMCLPDNSADFDESLTHEAVHALQDCITEGGINDSRMITVHSFLKNTQEPGDTHAADFMAGVKSSLAEFDDVPHIQEHYSKVNRDMEAEAYALEHNPQFVYDLLKICLQPE